MSNMFPEIGPENSVILAPGEGKIPNNDVWNKHFSYNKKIIVKSLNIRTCVNKFTEYEHTNPRNDAFDLRDHIQW